MTRHNQTHNWKVSDHVRGVEAAIGRKVDYFLVNTGKIPHNILETYAGEDEYPVQQDMEKDSRCIEGNFFSEESTKQNSGDVLHRSLLRHDPDTIANIIMEHL